MDYCNQLENILYNWLRFIGLLLGHDILRHNFTMNLYCIVVMFLTCCYPMLFIWTVYHFDGDLAIKASGYIGIGFQVSSHQQFETIKSINFVLDLYKNRISYFGSGPDSPVNWIFEKNL